MYELLTDRLPFPAQDVATFLQKIAARPPRFQHPELDPAANAQLSAVLSRALDHAPRKRFQSVQEFWQSLYAVLAATLYPVAVATVVLAPPAPPSDASQPAAAAPRSADSSPPLRQPDEDGAHRMVLERPRKRLRLALLLVLLAVALALLGIIMFMPEQMSSAGQYLMDLISHFHHHHHWSPSW